jgi:predicted anti-sigma-YlaC factor YlaD
VERPAWRRLVRDIVHTDDEEISCSECFDLVSDYVDREIAGTVHERRLPQLEQHLQQCGVCREEYEVLRDLARLEAEGRVPSTDDLRRSL